MSIKKQLFVAAGSAFLVGALVVCGCSGKQHRALRVGINPWPGYAAVALAELSGHFKEAGVQVKLCHLASLGEVRRAFERGQVDIMCGTLVELMVAQRHMQGAGRVFFVSDLSVGADAVFARPPAVSMVDLAGKPVGVEPDSLDEVVLALAGRRHGLGLSDFTIVPMPKRAMAEAFRRGEIDAAPSYPPDSLQLEKEGAVRIFDTAQVPGAILAVFAARRGLIDERSGDLARFVMAYEKALVLARSQPDKVGESVAKHLGMSQQELQASYSGLRLFGVAEQAPFFSGAQDSPAREAYVAVSEVLESRGHGSVVPFSELFDKRVIEEAGRGIGP